MELGAMTEIKSCATCIHSEGNIQLKQQKTMALSNETIERLAEALAPEAVLHIRQSEEFIQFLTEQLTVFLKEKMGEMDNDVAVEIIGSLIAEIISLW